MSIESEVIKKIARLARLNLDQKEAQNLSEEISNILGLIDQMNAIDTENVSPMTHPFDAQLRLREDQVTAGDQRKHLQAFAPDAEHGLYRVPKVIE